MHIDILNKVKLYIQNNQLSRAAQILVDEFIHAESGYLNEMLIYMADIRKLEKDQRLGIESASSIRRENNRITQSILQLIDELEKEPLQQKTPIVYISYAWEQESEKIAESFERAAKAAAMDTIRDKLNGVLYKGNIQEFMQIVGAAKSIVVIISDKYLKSQSCMYEMLQIMENKNLSERVFPIIVSSANIYDPVKRTNYIVYWQKQWKALNDSLKRLEDLSAIERSQKDLKLYSDIKNIINEITGVFANINSLTADIHVNENFKQLIEAINQSFKH